MVTSVKPGDVLVVRDPGVWARFIRIGALLRLAPHQWNHVVIAHHVDDAGTYWGVEGRPGVVGWRNLDHYLGDPTTLSNADQPKTDEQRQVVCDTLEAMLSTGTRYDWSAIVVATLQVISPLWRLRRKEWGDDVPGHVVCSSAADYSYERAGLATPSADQWCTPWDWALFIQRRGWERRR